MNGSASPKDRSPLSDLQRLRDEIRVRLHLAGLEAKAHWEALESKLTQLESDVSIRGESTWNAAAEVLLESARAFRSVLSQRGEQSQRLVREIMTVNPGSCRVSDTLEDAARLMWELDCGIIPVVDEEQHPLGTVTDRDICMAAYFQRLRLSEVNVGSAMSRSIHVCSVDDTVMALNARLGALQIRRMPVIDSAGKLVGMVSIADVARSLTPRLFGDPEHPGLEQTLAAISKSRSRRSESPSAPPTEPPRSQKSS